MLEPPADLLLHNAAVYTVGDGPVWAQAVAVHGNRIAAVGSDDELRSWRGRHTEVVDLAGQMVLPGFVDSHVHPLDGGLTQQRCDLYELEAADAYLGAIRAYALAHPHVEWILGGGWSMDAFHRGTPTKGALDAVVPDRPVYLPNRDGHGAWVNSRALQLAGVDKDTPDPVDGRIERDAAGNPTGTLHEGAESLVERLIPPPTGAELRASLLAAQRYLHTLGITGWQDAIVGQSSVGPDSLGTYLELAGSGQLTARVVGALWWDRSRGQDQIVELLDRRSIAAVGRFRATSVKIMLDGVCENFTAAMTDPYLDDHGADTHNRGIGFIDPHDLGHYVTRLDAEGFQIHFHAIGDRAVREALDAIEAARDANGPQDHRHHIAHIQVVHPADRDRFAQLEVVANAQPLWACAEPQMTELTIPFLGPQRTRWQYPFASLARAGATLAGGSDWPVSTPDPLAEMHVAVNRIAPGRTEAPFLPDEAISLQQAIRSFTMGSAFVNHAEQQTGSIEVGKLADLSVIDRNLFDQPQNEIAHASVVRTLVGGRTVFAKSARN